MSGGREVCVCKQLTAHVPVLRRPVSRSRNVVLPQPIYENISGVLIIFMSIWSAKG